MVNPLHGPHPTAEVPHTPDSPRVGHPQAQAPAPTHNIPLIHTAEINLASNAAHHGHQQLEGVTHTHALAPPNLAQGGHAFAASPMMLAMNHGHIDVPTHHHAPPPEPPKITNGRLDQQHINAAMDVLMNHFQGQVGGEPIPEGILSGLLENDLRGLAKAHGLSLDDPHYPEKAVNIHHMLARSAASGPYQDLMATRIGQLIGQRRELSAEVDAWKAETGAVTIKRVNQTDLLARETDPRVSAGVCQAASYDWVLGLGRAPGMLSLSTQPGVITDRTRHLQVAHARAEGEAGVLDRAIGTFMPGDQLAADGVTERREILDGSPRAEFSRWLAKAAATGHLADVGGACILGLAGPEGSHAIGFQVTPKTGGGYDLRFYDTNQGLFELNARNFESLAPPAPPTKAKTKGSNPIHKIKEKVGAKKAAGPQRPPPVSHLQTNAEVSINSYLAQFYPEYDRCVVLAYPMT